VNVPVLLVGNLPGEPTTKFGCPLPTPAGVLKPAFVNTPHASLHQSRVFEHGPMMSCF
jgi:hypothetical protein